MHVSMVMNPKQHVREIHDILTRAYPRERPMLDFETPFQLLVAVIMSAQTTDAGVNRITPELFRRYPDPPSLAAAPVDDLERIIRPTGYFRQKARNIRGAALAIEERYGGRVPDSMEALVELPGVGRKTANVILGQVFERPAVIVDTHFSRVTRRMGFTEAIDPERIEGELREIVPPELQTRFSMAVNLHGRSICLARKPRCTACPVRSFCLWPDKILFPESDHP